jgi:imidazolonepropionase-like amidohydrolase
MVSVLFRNARVFDGHSEVLREGVDVLVAGGLIRRIAPPAQTNEPVDVVDCSGCVLMLDLIDAHVHVYAAGLNFTRIAQSPFSYLAHFAARFMRASLDRGFTTLRDVGGADVGLASALREGLLGRVPLLFYGGRAISQAGGHGDFRPGDHGCGCHMDSLTVIADGVDAVRHAVREELRRGASHVKLMASGGIASPTDPLECCQYSDDEIRAAVDEATRANSYVATHCHPAEAVRRSVALGVRSIEHATLIDRETADFMAERGAFAVPTMATLAALAEQGETTRPARGERGKAAPHRRPCLRRSGDHEARRRKNGSGNRPARRPACAPNRRIHAARASAARHRYPAFRLRGKCGAVRPIRPPGNGPRRCGGGPAAGGRQSARRHLGAGARWRAPAGDHEGWHVSQAR